MARELWLNSLQTETPEQGFELAIKLSRIGVNYIQPDTNKLKKIRAGYADNVENLIAISQVVALNFQTIAAANNHWKQINKNKKT